MINGAIMHEVIADNATGVIDTNVMRCMNTDE